MKRNKLFFLITNILLGIFFCLNIFAFQWPQENISTESFSVQFGQLRKDTFNTSIVFSEQAEVFAIEDGAVIALTGQDSQEMGWFHSPLGNSVILAHENQLLSVYANLKTTNIDNNAKHIQTGTSIGTSGGSGWQHGQCNLEFQIVDTQKDAVINPKLLMPQIKDENQLRLTGITAVSRSGEEFDLRIRRNLPAGSYRIYRNRINTAFPYKTTVSVNGAAVETITYDILSQKEGTLTAEGKTTYSSKEIYPDATKQLLADIKLAQGRNTLNITAETINGTETSLTYILDIR